MVEQGGLEDRSSPAGSRSKAAVGSGVKAPRSYRYNEILCL